MIHRLEVNTQGEGHMVDLTPQIQAAVDSVDEGLATIAVIGSTAAITTIEFEPGLQRDFPEALERVAPRDGSYAHEATWNDDNGHSHIRASLIGGSISVPVAEGKLMLGTWQQIVLLELDTRPRQRTVVVQILS